MKKENNTPDWKKIRDQIEKLPCFLNINREESEKRLANCPEGVYLIRPSSLGVRFFALDIVSDENRVVQLPIGITNTGIVFKDIHLFASKINLTTAFKSYYCLYEFLYVLFPIFGKCKRLSPKIWYSEKKDELQTVLNALTLIYRLSPKDLITKLGVESHLSVSSINIARVLDEKAVFVTPFKILFNFPLISSIESSVTISINYSALSKFMSNEKIKYEIVHHNSKEDFLNLVRNLSTPKSLKDTCIHYIKENISMTFFSFANVSRRCPTTLLEEIYPNTSSATRVHSSSSITSAITNAEESIKTAEEKTNVSRS